MDRLWDWDQSVFRAIHLGMHREWLDPIFWVISTTGLGYVQVALVLLTVRWKQAFNRGRLTAADWHPLTSRLLVSWVVVSLLNSALKRVIPRERPSNLEWAVPQEGFLFNSFSSGHTASSFAIAFAALYIGKGRHWSGWALLGWASMVGFSRIYRGVHWPTDVIAGIGSALFGATIVSLVWELRVQKAQARSK